MLSPSKSARASSEPGAGRSGLGVHASALSGRVPGDGGGETRALAPASLFEGLAFPHRRAERLPLPLQNLQLLAMHTTGEKPQIHPGCIPWAAFLGGRRTPAPRGPGPSKSPVPSYPHQHQAGKHCLDKLTLIFMIGRRLRARLDGLFNCVCKMSWRGQLCQCRIKRGGPSPQVRETPCRQELPGCLTPTRGSGDSN